MAKKDKAKGKTKTETKKGKDSGSKTTSKEVEIDQEAALLWEENLRACVINDGSWKCNVTLLLQSKSEYTKLVEWFEDGAQSGSRRVVKNIASSELVLELKLTQGKKGMAKFHPLQGVCTAAAKSLAGSKLPVDILAKLIKYKIIRFKEADLASKRAQIIEERELRKTVQRMMLENEMSNVESLGGTFEKTKKGSKSGGKGSKSGGKGSKKSTSTKDSKKGKKKNKGKSEVKGGKGKKKKELGDELNECWDGSNLVFLETPDKWNTKLRKRGENWKDSHNIDDAPKDGADLYVALTGFYDPNLIIELIKIGVPLNAVVKLELDEEESPLLNSILSLEGNTDLENIPAPPGSPRRNASMLESPCGKDVKKQPAGHRKTTSDELEAKNTDIMNFWTGLEGFNKDRDNLLLLKDVALANFPVYSQLKVPTCPEEVIENQKTMYDVISQMLYDMERISRQHVNYVRNVKLLKLEPISANASNNLDGMDIYKTMVQLMPMECQSVSFILNCMLEQVVSLGQVPQVLEILPDQENITLGNKSIDEGVALPKGTSKEEIKQKSKSDINSPRVGLASKEGINKGVSKELVASRKTSKEVGVTKGELSPRAKRSKERSKEIVVKEDLSVPLLDIPVVDTSELDMAQASLDSRIKQLNKDYNLFQVPSPRAIKRDPLVIRYGDSETLRSYHVAMPEVDLAAIFEQVTKHGWLETFWNKYDQQTLEEKLRFDFHVHQLWNCMEDRNLTLRMLKNYLHLLIFEKLEGNEETFGIDCNKAGTSNIRLKSGSDVSTTGFMKFTDKLFKSRRNKDGKGSPHQNTLQALPSDNPESEPSPGRTASRAQRMECIGEMFENPDIVCLTDPLKCVLTGIRPMEQRETLVDLHKYTLVEEFNANVMLQNLMDAHAHFYGCTVEHYAPTDVILMNFHNGNQKDDLVVASWMGKLTTPVALRDFCQFVYDEESQWLSEKEEEYVKELNERKIKRKATGSGEAVIPLSGNVHAINTAGCTDDEFIKAGSIKHNEILKKQLGDQKQGEEESKQDKKGKGKGKGRGKSKDGKGKKEKKEPKEKKEKKGKVKKEKGKSTKGKKDKSASKSDKKKKKEPEELEVDTEVEIPVVQRPSLRCAREGEPHSFYGYDLEPLRFQVDGKSAHFFAPDGTRVESEVREKLFTNCKLLKTSVQKRGHTLFVYNTVDLNRPNIEKPFTFHIVSANQCILAFGKRQEKQRRSKPTVIEPPITTETREEAVISKPGSSPVKAPRDKANQNEAKADKESKTKQSNKSANQGTTIRPIPESEPKRSSTHPVIVEEAPVIVEQISWKYDLRASWPSGLVLETVVGSTDLDPFHIKQRYLQKGPECEKIRNEDYRIFLRNGTVLKFMTNGFVEVLCPDSTITVCKSFKKPEANSRRQSTTPRRPKSAECPEGVRLEGKEWKALGKEVRSKPDSLADNLNRGLALSPPPPPQMEVVNYHVITPTGEQFSVHEDIDPYPNLTEATNDSPYKPINLVVDDKYEKFLLRRATDYELGEVFIRRGDGTNTLMMPDGRMIVVFPDGTRITTWYTIDEEAVTLEWTEDEMMAVTVAIAKRQEEEARLERLEELAAQGTSSLMSSTASLGDKPRKDSKGHIRRASLNKSLTQPQANDKSSQSVSNKKKSKSKTDIPRKLSHPKPRSRSSSVDVSQRRDSSGKSVIDPALFTDPEGFVSVRMSCCLEHPNYATVSYAGEDRSAELGMPYEMTVRVAADGLYSADIDEKTQLEVRTHLEVIDDKQLLD